MLLVFSYHRAAGPKYSTPLPVLKARLSYLSQNYPIVTPGDRLFFNKLQICLTFDDAYFDFYHYVFPLLKELGLKAVLAVPAGLIGERRDQVPSQRLNTSYKGPIKEKTRFCTWQELREMADSQNVTIASHSYSHVNLLNKTADPELEILQSKRILEDKLQKEITTFVYPMGKFDRKTHKLVKSYYKYAMRLGSAWNLSWQNLSGLIYRIPSDGLTAKDAHLRMKSYLSRLWFFLLNSARGR